MGATNIHKNECHVSGLLDEKECRESNNGNLIAKFSMRVTVGSYTNRVHVTAFKQLAARIRNADIGSFIRVVGRLQSNPVGRGAQELVAVQVVTPEDGSNG